MLRPQQVEARQQPFGYICRACSRCCPHKLIQVNPYETARLAHRLGLSTAEFRARYTERDGVYLKRTEDDTCVFLTDDGCGVHPDRPLVCRLYPLGRRTTPDGIERWDLSERPADSQGEITGAGTVADWIATQGAAPYLEAADDYAAWVREAYAVTEPLSDDRPDVALAGDLLDMDSMIAAWCSEHGTREPDDIEARRQLHLKILHLTLDGGKS
jgi:uncharacterized protein